MVPRCELFIFWRHLQVTSGPEPIDQIEWFKDNELIRSQPRFVQSSRDFNHFLEIHAIDVDDEGIYKCVLLNTWGIASCSAEVLVEGELVLKCISVCYFPNECCCVSLNSG